MRKLTTIFAAAIISFGVIGGDVKTKETKAVAEKATTEKVDAQDMAKRRELAEKFMVVMKVESQMKQSFKMVRQTQAYMLKKMLKDDKEIKNAEKIQGKMMKIVEEEMSWDKLKPVFIDVYASVYTAGELDALIKFFSSPKGQAFVDKTPEVSKLTMTKIQGIMMNMVGRMKKEIDKMKKEEAEKIAKEAAAEKKDVDKDKDAEEEKEEDQMM